MVLMTTNHTFRLLDTDLREMDPGELREHATRYFAETRNVEGWGFYVDSIADRISEETGIDAEEIRAEIESDAEGL